MKGEIGMQRQQLKVNASRLRSELERFAVFGKTENGGVTRLALSKEDRAVRDYFRTCCEELGMEVKIDDMGCMYAVLQGSEERPPVVTGSHLDTVKKGGRFDGVLGVVAGLEVVRTLVENKMKPKAPIVIANITNEEGARFEPSMMASGVLSGKFNKAEMLQKRDISGITFGEALHESGYEGDIRNRLAEAEAFVELHIEQGPILEQEGLSIGVVECVVGMVCYELTVWGDSNHAGTTPMRMRKDALFVANDLMQEIRTKLGRIDQDLVFTMGRMNVYPNIHTVIPNKVIFTLEARHKDPAIIKQVEDVIAGLHVEVEARKLWSRDTVWFDKDVCNAVQQATESCGYSYKRMVSGAGHDAQFLASYVPTAMIFVPSVNGKSHCEEEYTPWEACEKGVNVLLETIWQLSQ